MKNSQIDWRPRGGAVFPIFTFLYFRGSIFGFIAGGTGFVTAYRGHGHKAEKLQSFKTEKEAKKFLKSVFELYLKENSNEINVF